MRRKSNLREFPIKFKKYGRVYESDDGRYQIHSEETREGARWFIVDVYKGETVYLRFGTGKTSHHALEDAVQSLNYKVGNAFYKVGEFFCEWARQERKVEEEKQAKEDAIVALQAKILAFAAPYPIVDLSNLSTVRALAEALA